MAPSLTWSHYGADGGDLVTAVARGSIPHPPGFPTYLLLGELFIRLPWGEPAWRLNTMSAVLGGAAASLAAVAAWRLARGQDTVPGSPDGEPRDQAEYAGWSLPMVVCIGLCLGLAPLFWSQALIAEVYAPAAFFVALLLALALCGGPAWAVGLAWGVGLGVHLTLLFLVPLVVWGVWGERKRRGWRLAQAGLLGLVGWGTLYGPLLLLREGVPSPWGDVSTPAGWWALVSGQMYHGYPFALAPAAVPQRLLGWVGILVRQFTPVGAVLAGVGLVRLWRAHRGLMLASMLAFGAFSLYAIGYDTADSLVYLVPALPLVALWLGVGLAWVVARLTRRLRQGAAWVLLSLPLLQALLFWGSMDVSGDREAIVWAERVLEEAPSGAVLLTTRDAHTFTLWYARDVLGWRPDVVVVDEDLWGREPYCQMLDSVLACEVAGENLSLEEAARQAGRPVVTIGD